MKKMNVLVFPCGSEIGLELHRSLCYSTHFTLFGGSSIADHGRFVYKNYIGNIPFVEDYRFIDDINKIIDDNDIEYIFPAHDSVVLELAKAESIGKLHCRVITSDLKTCQLTRSKEKTYNLLKDSLPTPKIFGYSEITRDDYPLFLKPDIGQGSKGTHAVYNKEDLDYYLNKDPELLILEYLPGKEFTIDCFTDKTGTLLFSEGRLRARIQNGISVNSVHIKDKRFLLYAQKINDLLSFRGVWFFQVKERANSELVLMEVSTRVAGTMGFSRSRGVNLALLSLFDALNFDVSIDENDYQISIDRALQNVYQHNISYEHVYLDFDDLVILNGKVNPMVMAFVYQCFNKGVKIHLLTKHKQDLPATLKKYHLEKVFDDIIWITDKNDKYKSIKEKNAILIDDSFAERKDVSFNLGLPVFDAHTIECLIEPL